MRRTLLPVLLALVLLAGATGLALAESGKGSDKKDDKRGSAARHPEFRQAGSKWILHNDDIAVSFASGKGKARPDLRVAFNGSDDERAGYRVMLLRICEVDDSLACKGSLPRLNLAKADEWNFVTETSNESTTITMVRSKAQAIVTLVWHLNATSKAVKYDVKIDNWRWGNASHKLLLDQVVLGRNVRNETGARVNVVDSGYISWATSASTNLGPAAVESIVKGIHADDDNEEDEDERAATSGAHLQLVFNGTGGYSHLDYDPELGIASTETSPVAPVPAAGVLAGLAIAAVAAIALRRKRA